MDNQGPDQAPDSAPKSPPPNTEALALWAEWVSLHGDYLLQIAMARVRDRDTAEDLVQETFVAAVKAHSRREGRSSLRTWLAGILRHKIIDYFRESTRTMVVTDLESKSDPEGDFEGGFFDTVGHWKPTKLRGWGASPSDEAEQNDLLHTLQSCLGKLPEVMARMFVLREMEEMETEEVCTTLGITENSLYVSLHRARFRLRRCLEVNWYGTSAEADA